ncbi:Uma2 family endonuclease [Streptomyces tendae]
MTVMAERTSQMSVEEFETIAAAAPETVTLEFINGRIGVKAVTDGDHSTGRAKPDAVLAPEAHFAGRGEWADPSGTLMVVEVTSYDSDTDRRDRHEKPAAYGQAEIPVHLLIDRDSRTLTVHSSPDRKIGGYRTVRTAKFGEKVLLPESIGIELDTEILENHAR